MTVSLSAGMFVKWYEDDVETNRQRMADHASKLRSDPTYKIQIAAGNVEITPAVITRYGWLLAIVYQPEVWVGGPSTNGVMLTRRVVDPKWKALVAIHEKHSMRMDKYIHEPGSRAGIIIEKDPRDLTVDEEGP